MTTPKCDRDFWEQLWAKTVREYPDKVARRPPNAHLIAEAASVHPGAPLTPAADMVRTRCGWPRADGRSPRAAAGTGVDAGICARRRR
jgi:hypothetical protein